MFTRVFDELNDLEMAYASMEKAVAAMTLIVRGFTIEYMEAMAGIPIAYADIECWDAVVVACTRFELSRVSEWTTKTRKRLQHRQHAEAWDEYAKADKLEQQARNLWEVARALSQLRSGGGE